MGLKNKRILAFLIDLIIVNAIIQLFGMLVQPDMPGYRLDTEYYTLISRFSYDVVFYLGYFLVFDVFAQGVTVGKKATNLVIVQASQHAVGNIELVKRTFLKMVGMFVLPVSALVYLFFNKTLQDELMGLKVSLSKQRAL
ncbi:RDD family protein [Muriicola sp.]|uniref:RDD family protein n=1 Tax=Muriicola sp. TaxID=2020856 RepID=UPI003C76C7DB